MKRIAIAGATLALMVPGTAVAQGTPSASENAAKACKDERARVGATTFKATHGTNRNKSNAFGKCVSKRTRTEQANLSNASKQCKAERALMGETDFNIKYATNKRKTNGFGKCVSGKAKEASTKQTNARVNAAKACKAERAANAAAFKATYGTNKNKSNAFGKCVSAKAKAQNDS